jgi:hypothetical protein
LLTRDEMIVILEEIAREGANSAKIQAIKVLLDLQAADMPLEDELERILRTK